MAQLTDNHALLIFRVGSVLCCAPTLCIEALITPPSLTHPPGSSDSHPGIFRHDGKLVSLIEVRQLFGVEKPDRTHPGRIVICYIENRHTGFLVDEVIDVIKTPASGWGQLPSSLSGGIFNRSLLLDEKIHLYCEFEKLTMIRSTGFLKHWIQQLYERSRPRESAPTLAETRVNHIEKKPVPAKTVIEPGATSCSPTTVSPAIPDFRPSPIAQSGKQHDSHIQGNKADKLTPIRKHVTVKNTHQPENKKRHIAASVKPVHAATPPFRTSSAATRPDISRAAPSRLPAPHPVMDMPADDASTSAHHTGINLPIMAFVFICIGLIGTLAYLQPNQDTNPVTQPVADMPATEVLAAVKPRLPPPKRVPSPTTDKMATKISDVRRNNQFNNVETTSPQHGPDSHDRYQASIKHRRHEVTIILTAPADDAVIRTDGDNPVAHGPRSKTHPAIGAIPESAPASSRRSSHPHIDQVVHIVVKGDTLWHIAQRYIHDPFRYPELARLNKIRNPDLIYPGDRVRIIRIYR